MGRERGRPTDCTPELADGSEVAATWEPIESLQPWGRNPRRNDGEPVDRVAKSIQRFGFGAPIVARAQDRRIIAGHTRWKAAKQLGMTQVPVRFMPVDEAEAAALALADNKLTEITPWDDEVLAGVLRDLEAQSVDIDGLGWSAEEIDALLAEGEGDGEGASAGDYTTNIKAPTYEPKGEKPPVDALFDDSKTRALVAEIDATHGLPSDVAAFLRTAATRHTAFNFAEIAEYYCHAPAEVQALMERSALVIIDFDKAIEGGFVRLTEAIRGLTAQEQDDAG